MSGETAVGITLAFNTIGWNSQNFLFNAVDAILGDTTIANAFGNQNADRVSASITKSDIDADGDLIVSAIGASTIDATVKNDSTSAAVALYGAKGSSVGIAISSNLINSIAEASVDNNGILTDADTSNNGFAIDADGAFSVTATDTDTDHRQRRHQGHLDQQK